MSSPIRRETEGSGLSAVVPETSGGARVQRLGGVKLWALIFKKSELGRLISQIETAIQELERYIAGLREAAEARRGRRCAPAGRGTNKAKSQAEEAK